MTFSGAVRITDLNDFIAPSQACVVALNGKSDGKATVAESSEITLQPRATLPAIPTGPRLPLGPKIPGAPPPKEGDAVKVTLHDCLACSGCVTTAETMLLEQQSTRELQAALARPDLCVVVSVSPQSRAALAALYGLDPCDAWQRLVAWLRHMGVSYVCDIGTGRDLALLESAAEFIARYKAAHPNLCAAAQRHNSNGPSHPTQSPQASSPYQLTYLDSCLTTQSNSNHTAGDHDMTDGCQGNGGGVVHVNGCGHDKQGMCAQGLLPVLASACPGWVCYAEKTQGPAIIPHLATTKSPQAIMGTLVKRLIAHKLGLPSHESVFHCSVMPCYDKKLEASRSELTVPDTQTPEVDCCITTHELHQWLQDHGMQTLTHDPQTTPTTQHNTDPTQPPLHPAQQNTAQQQQPDSQHSNLNSYSVSDMEVDYPASQSDIQQHGMGADQGRQGSAPHDRPSKAKRRREGAQDVLTLFDQSARSLWGLPGGSGGYMEFVFRVAAAELFGKTIPPGPLPLQQLRNADFQQAELCGEDGSVLLRCAIVNGFRNIQTLMRQIKTRRCQYHYVEVMACPSGCLNGGGQIKPQAGQTAAQVLEQAELAYNSASVTHRQPAANPLVPALYSEWVQGTPGSAVAQELLHTTFTHRENKLAHSPALASDW